MSLLPPPSQASTSTFASISLNWTDRLRLLQFPPSVVHSIADQLRASWPPGIQAEQALAPHCYEYKLRGTPFGSIGSKEAVGSRRLVRDVLAWLYVRGWTLETPVSHSRYPRSKDSLVFRQRRVVESAGWKGKEKQQDEKDNGGRLLGNNNEEVVLPAPVEWLVVAPMHGDRLRIIRDLNGLLVDGGNGEKFSSSSSSSSSAATARMRDSQDELGVLVQALKQAIAGVDYFQSGEWSHDSYEFKLKGYPWNAIGGKTVKVEVLLLAVFETLDRLGWRAYASVRHRSDDDDTRKSETMFFVRDVS
ncbi:hypothetical protein GE09DRAFT_711958 [Coniochaeta sp. 2T2.1]|nr:hypothetical protein GE09DRAFT_711958 [Coniochaeta sp. 2T2.1]